MNLVIDLSQKGVLLILKQSGKEIARRNWGDHLKLEQDLVKEIDKMLRKNKLTLGDVKAIKVIPSKESLVSTRIAKATVLGLKVEVTPFKDCP